MISIRKKTGHAGTVQSATDRNMPLKSGFLNFSQKTDCGLALLSVLSQNNGTTPLSLRDIADTNKLSFFYLQKVALDLRKAGIITADRGKFGGYRLTKSPANITLIQALEALEGRMSVMRCLPHEEHHITCSREASCHIRSGFGMLNQIILQSLSQLTLLDFLTSSWNKNTINSK